MCLYVYNICIAEITEMKCNSRNKINLTLKLNSWPDSSVG